MRENTSQGLNAPPVPMPPYAAGSSSQHAGPSSYDRDELMPDLGDDQPFGDDASNASDDPFDAGFAQLDIGNADGGLPEVDNFDRTLLPSGFDEQEFRAAAAYDDLIDDDDDDDNEQGIEVEFDELQPGPDNDESVESVESPAPPAPVFGMIGPPEIPGARQARAQADEDASTLIQHVPKAGFSMSDFDLAIGLMAHFTGTSGSEWTIMREVLCLPQAHGEARVPVNALPRALSTLKRAVDKLMPRIDSRVIDIPLAPEKLPTLPGTLQGQQATATPTAKLYYFDLVDLFKTFFESNIETHQGMAHFVDRPTELYHSRAWSASVRTTSGHYAHILVNNMPTEAIFPSDFVFFACSKAGCRCEDDNAGFNEFHIGRVVGVGLDYRTQRLDSIDLGHVCVEIQEAFRPHQQELHDQGRDFQPPLMDDELIIDHRVTHIVPQEYIVSFCQVTLDRTFGVARDDPTWAPTKTGDKLPFVKFPEQRPAMKPAENVLVRRVIQDDGTLVPLGNTHPIRAELELQCYGRSHYTQEWDRVNQPDREVISCPVMTFIDGFGLFRNAVRSLVGFYMTPAGLNAHDRNRRANTFPIFLSPHGAVFEDVVSHLKSFIPLDKGVEVTIKGKRTLLSVFTLCYLGDFPQQNNNAGFMGPTAAKFCRFCLVGKKTTVDAMEDANPGHIIDFDDRTHGRYHFQIQEMRRYMATLTASQKKEYASQWGLREQKSNLEIISPALDVIMTRAPDAAHSEYNGMAQVFHDLLMRGIMKKTSQKDYAGVLRTWKAPRGWNRLPSPIHHLKSYSLSEHARWSVIIPGLLNSWLKDAHIRPRFWNAAVMHPKLEGRTVVEYIVATAAALARANTAVMGMHLTTALDLQGHSWEAVMEARRMYQQLCIWASFEMVEASGRRRESRERSASVSSVGSAGSSQSYFTQVVNTRVGATVGQADELRQVLQHDQAAARVKDRKGKATWKPTDVEKLSWIGDAIRPNVHIGIHHDLFIDEYALSSNLDTLIGENEHR